MGKMCDYRRLLVSKAFSELTLGREGVSLQLLSEVTDETSHSIFVCFLGREREILVVFRPLSACQRRNRNWSCASTARHFCNEKAPRGDSSQDCFPNPFCEFQISERRFFY